jgi:chitodextrinase
MARTTSLVLVALIAVAFGSSAAGSPETPERPAVASPEVDKRHSGSLDMSVTLQAIQADDNQNPAQLWWPAGVIAGAPNVLVVMATSTWPCVVWLRVTRLATRNPATC